MAAQRVGGTDAREHEELRRIERAARQHDLARRVERTPLAGLTAWRRVRAVEPLALQILHADRAAVLVEQHPGRQRVEHDSQAIGMAARDVEHAFARARAPVAVGGQRQIADAGGVALHQPPVVRIEQALKKPADPIHPVAVRHEGFEARCR